MQVLNTLRITLLLFLGFSSAYGASFECPYTNSIPSLVCKGSLKVKNQAELDVYKSNLGVKSKKVNEAKNLVIDFEMNLTRDFTLSTPCEIRIEENRKINSSAKVCLHGNAGINIGEYFTYNGGDLTLESSGSIGIQNNAKVSAPQKNIKLQSLGVSEKSQAFIRHDLELTAKNLIIESKNKGFIGRNSRVNLEENLGIYTSGDDEASIRLGSKVTAKKIEVASLEETRIADQTILNSSEIILNGARCLINKNAVITATERFGNCFLQSQTKAKFFVDKNTGTHPLTISFSASTIKDATSFEWSFGDGEVLTTTTPTATHQYTKTGIFTTTLKYKVKKSLKSAGSIQINVKEPVIVPTTPPRGYFNFFQEESGTFVYLKAFIRRTQFDIAKAYYIINDDPARRIDLTNFNANSQSNFDAGSFGTHKVTLFVEDKAGQKFNTTNFINLKENFREIAPYIRFTAVQSAVNTVFVNMNASFLPLQNEIFKTFTVDYGDGFVETIEDKMTSTHTYAAPGTYNVKVSATFQGNTRTTTVAVNITSQNFPAVSPVSGFDYFILDFAGNVTFADEKSGTPNGEIISYEWNLGDGTVAYGKRISHFFNPGEYLVSLTVTDTAGLRATQTQKIKIASEGDDLVSQLSCYKEGQKTIECNIFALDKTNQIQRVKVEWGDGASEIITGPEIAEWGLYFGSHEYAQYGTYNVKLTVDTTRGETKYSFHQESLNAPSPVANLYCSTNNLSVSCNGFGSYDPSGSPLTYTFDYGNGQIKTNTTGFSNYTYSDEGVYKVRLTVSNLYSLSNSDEKQITVTKPLNQAPFANISCTKTGNTISCDSFSSYDIDGNIAFVNWQISDGSTYNTNYFSHTFNSFGHYEVKLTVVDNLGAIKESVLTIPITEFNPVLVAECRLSKQTIICQSAGTNDPDGQIVERKWFINNVLVSSSERFESIISDNEMKIVHFEITDNSGLKIDKEIGSYRVDNNEIPIANFMCMKANEKILSCDASASFDDGVITKYNWTIGTQSFTGSFFEFQSPVDGPYIVRLTVEDQFGLISEIKENSYEMNPSIEDSLSLAKLEIVKSNPLAIFYPAEAEIYLKITDGQLSDDKAENTVSINEIGIEETEMQYTSEGLILSLNLSEGENKLSVNLKTVDNKYIRKDFTLFSGTRSIPVDLINGGAGSFKTINVKIPDYEEFDENISLVENQFTLDNVPNFDILIVANNLTRQGSQVIFKNELSATIEIKDFNSLASNSNNNFESGISGWELNNSTYSIQNKTLKLITDQNGVASLRRTVRATDVEPFVRFDADVYSTSKNDYFSLMLRNKTTGEVNFEFYSTKKLKEFDNLPKQDKFSLSNSIATNSSQDLVEIELKLYSKPNTEISMLNDILDIFFSKTIAQEEIPLNAETPGFKLSLFEVKEAYLKDIILSKMNKSKSIERIKKLSNDNIAFLSIGKYPVYSNNVVPFPIFEAGVKKPTNFLLSKFKILTTTEKNIKSLKILINDPRNNTTLHQSESSKMNIVNRKTDPLSNKLELELEAEFRLKSIDLQRENIPSEVNVVMLIDLESGEQVKHPLKNQRSSSLFSTLINLTSYANGFGASNRFSDITRDVDFGGDDWADPRILKDVEQLIVEGNSIGLKFNDFSRMNGGFFEDHLGHQNGREFDGRIEGYLPQRRIVNDKSYNLLSTKEHGTSVVKFLNLASVQQNVEKILVSYDPYKENSNGRLNSDFNSVLSYSCLSSGKIAKNLITNEGYNDLRKSELFLDLGINNRKYLAQHKDHFHFNFSKVYNKSLTVNRKNICYQFDKSSHKLKIKECESDLSLKMFDYEIWIKERFSDSVYEQLNLNSSGDAFEVPFDKQDIYSAKIIYKGEKSADTNVESGCFENNIFVDTRPDSYNCSDEFGRTIVQFQDSNYNDNLGSVFFGETARLKGQKIFEDDNFQTQLLNYVTPPLYYTSSICNNSKVDLLERISNSSITEFSEISENSTVLNSKITNTKLFDFGNRGPVLRNIVSFESSVTGDAYIYNSNLLKSEVKTFAYNPSSLIINNFILKNTNVLVNGDKGQIIYGISDGTISLDRGEMINSELTNAKLNNNFYTVSGNLKLTDSIIFNSTVRVLKNSISNSSIANNSDVSASSIYLLNVDNAGVYHPGTLTGSFANQNCNYFLEENEWICNGR